MSHATRRTGDIVLRIQHWHDHNGDWWLASYGGRPVGEGDTRDECLADARIRLSADYGVWVPRMGKDAR